MTPGEFVEFKDLFPEASTVHELVVTFLAVLELIRLGQAVIRLVDHEVRFARPGAARS